MGKVMRHTLGASLNIRHNLRSEERRVGKECRSGTYASKFEKRPTPRITPTQKADTELTRRETSKNCPCSIFFFKQKTAYDIGLGIPAEPLFRSEGVASDNRSS